jgi:hypothetical protein
MPAPARLALMPPLPPAQWTPLPHLGQALADRFTRAIAKNNAAVDAAMADIAHTERAARDHKNARLDAFQSRHIRPRAGAATPLAAPARPHPVGEELAPLPDTPLDRDRERHLRRFLAFHRAEDRRPAA